MALKKLLFTHIRPVNLIFIVIIQWLVIWFLSEKQLSRESYILVFCVNLATVLSAAAGYLINDMNDEETDRVNGKSSEGNHLTSLAYKRIYFLINLIAVAAAAYTLNVFFILLVVVNQVLLYIYSTRMKEIVFWDNILVALISASTLFCIYFLPFELKTRILDFLVISSFLATLVREIIKDMEDEEGDAASGYKTLVMQKGIKETKKIALRICWALLAIMTVFAVYLILKVYIYSFLWFTIFSLIPFAGIIFFIANAKTKKHYSQLSLILKIHMFATLLTVCFFR